MKNTVLISFLISLATTSFGQSDFDKFLGKFASVKSPFTLNKSFCDSLLSNNDLKEYLNETVDENFDSLVSEDFSEPRYCAGYLLENNEFKTILYSVTSKTARGQDLQEIAIATFSNSGSLIDKQILGSISDYNIGVYPSKELFTESTSIEIIRNWFYITNISTRVLLEEEWNPSAKDSTVTKTGYYLSDGRIYFQFKENCKDTARVKAKFLDFDLGDAAHYVFELASGEDIEFGGKENIGFQFAEGLDDSEMNSQNQGWGVNKELQGKWFYITYIEREQEMYIDGPIGKVKVIIKADLVEKEK